MSECYLSMCSFDSAIEAASNYLKVANDDRKDVEIQRAITTLGATFLEAALSLQNSYSERNAHAKQARRYLKESILEIPSDLPGGSLEKARMQLRSLTNLHLLECHLDNKLQLDEHFKAAQDIATKYNLNGDLCRMYLESIKYYLGHEDFVTAGDYLQFGLETLKHRRSENDFSELNSKITKKS